MQSTMHDGMFLAQVRRKLKCVCGLVTYCSPASWPQSQSEVSVESAGAWGEEEERQTLKARKEATARRGKANGRNTRRRKNRQSPSIFRSDQKKDKKQH